MICSTVCFPGAQRTLIRGRFGFERFKGRGIEAKLQVKMMGKQHCRRLTTALSLIAGTVTILGFLEACDNRLISLTRFIDPCGTFLANCNPGELAVNRADVGDFCIDPTCTVPGQCGPGQALGTITELCP